MSINRSEEYSQIAEDADPYKEFDRKFLKLNEPIIAEPKHTIELAKHHIGHQDVKQFLYDSVVFYLHHQEEFTRDNISVNKGILLYGLSGTGKSSLAKEAAQDIQTLFGDSKVTIIEICFHDLASQKVSGASEKITTYFEELRQDNRFKLIIMDEMESLAPVRHNAGVLALERTDALLKHIDDIPNTFIFGMSNHKEKIDPAMLREGRLGEVIEVTPPTEDEKKEFVQKWLNNGTIEYEPLVDLNIFIKGYNIVGADYRYVQTKLYTRYLQNKKVPLSPKDICIVHSCLTNKLNARGD